MEINRERVVRALAFCLADCDEAINLAKEYGQGTPTSVCEDRGAAREIRRIADLLALRNEVEAEALYLR